MTGYDLYTDRIPPALVRYIEYSGSSTLGVTVQLLNQYILDVKTFPKCLSLGMAQGSTKKSRNKKMAYTHHNDAMTSAHNTIQHLWCISHGIVMMSVSHFLVSRLFGASLSHS